LQNQLSGSPLDNLNPTDLTNMLVNWADVFLPRLVGALIILVGGLAAIRWLSRALGRVVARTPRIDPTLQPILTSALRYAGFVLVLILVLGQLGIETTSLLAVLGAAGLAIGLALQGTLSNIAAGLMLLLLRPFRVGDFIEIPSVAGLSGWVQEIGLFTCSLQTYEGLFLFVPNSVVWNAPLKNHSRHPARMVVFSITLPASADEKRAREALLDLTKGEDFLIDPKPSVSVESAGTETLRLNLTCWTSPARFARVTHSLVESIRSTLGALGPEFRPQQIARTLPTDADPSRFLIEGSRG
jgi:small conductance mechanosensitive channel